jgi:hypothetical protein
VPRLRSRRTLAAAAGVLVLAIAVPVAAQFGRGGGQRGFGFVTKARPQDFDGLFHFCRIAFGSDFRGDDGGNWSVDYPRADINLSIRLSELTKTPVSMDAGGQPRPLLVQMTDPELFGCPFVMMTEVGSASINETEAAHLRDYLLKGGFLWADDFWGSYAWEWWAAQMTKVLPPSEYPWIDLTPEHPLFRAQYEVKQTPQIASINFWSGSGGSTSERGTDSEVVHTRAILDRQGRIMVLATHNTDLGDSFEREGDDPTYFYNFSVPGYQFGINALLYAMTH